jgi:hypothetical protein
MPGLLVAKMPAEPRTMNLRLELGDRDPIRFASVWSPPKLPEQPVKQAARRRLVRGMASAMTEHRKTRGRPRKQSAGRGAP